MGTACPTRDQISAYLLGNLDDAGMRVMGHHLRQCSRCRSVAEQLEQVADDLIHSLRAPAPDACYLDEPECRQAMVAAQAMLRPPSPAEQSEPRSADRAAVECQRLGQYWLAEKLAQGGMGTVYQAIHTRLHRPVAIKVLKAECTQDGQLLARFLREMAAVGTLDHPSIVRATDAGEEGGVYYLVMELIEGRDLARLIKALGPLPVGICFELARQTAVGLQYFY